LLSHGGGQYLLLLFLLQKEYSLPLTISTLFDCSSPGGLKCLAFTLFDQKYSPKEVRYLLRDFRDPEYPQSFANTIRKYHFLWTKAQEIKRSKKS